MMGKGWDSSTASTFYYWMELFDIGVAPHYEPQEANKRVPMEKITVIKQAADSPFGVVFTCTEKASIIGFLAPGSILAAAGIEVGDRLCAVNDTKVPPVLEGPVVMTIGGAANQHPDSIRASKTATVLKKAAAGEVVLTIQRGVGKQVVAANGLGDLLKKKHKEAERLKAGGEPEGGCCVMQ